MAQNYNDAPPAYDSIAANNASGSSTSRRPDRLQPVARNGIPPSARRSMEDEARPLPHGWVRRFDEKSQHQFFVDTNAKPPRSIWHHPYDDETYLSTLSSEERERIQEEYKQPHLADIAAEDTDDEDHHHHHTDQKHAQPSVGLAAATAGAASHSTPDKEKKKESLGQKMKDKLTGSTHEERVAERKRREAEERAAYQRHLKIRDAMNRAAQTGQPQLIGKDKNGKDLYIEPPPMQGGGYYGMQPYNPYNQGGYRDQNATYVRPAYPYQRPYGPGYGGGYGYGYGPGLGMGTGLLGGLLLGGLLF